MPRDNPRSPAYLYDFLNLESEEVTRAREQRYLRSHGYRTEVVIMADGQYYWHLWLENEHINGGLSSDWGVAFDESLRYARQHLYYRGVLRW